MPTTRRSTGSTRGRAAPSRGQSTISFAHRVTKNLPKDSKKEVLAPAIKKLEPTEEPEPTEDKVDEIVPKELEAKEEPDLAPQEAPEEKVEVEKTETELKAEKITTTQINKYWRAIEAERKAPRLHQQDLTVNEKVLRYFDVSSQYGPCIGVSRMKRWQRADRLGLKPPIEVLSVLMKEENAGTKDFENAHMDQILNSTAVGA